MDILSVILPRLVSDGRTDYNVRPPSVREALILLHAGPLAVSGDLDAQRIVLPVVRDWYPRKLWRGISKKRIELILKDALEIANDVIRKSEAKKTGKPVDYMRLIAQFMDVYHYSFGDLLEMPWPAFIALSDQIGTLKAIRKLDQLPVAMIPHYADPHARAGAIMSLRTAAGLSPLEEMSDEQAESSVNALAADFAMAGALVGSA